MPYTKEQIDALFSALPSDLKKAIASVDTIQILNGLQEKHKLHVDQMGKLSSQVTLVTAGAASPQHFVGDIEQAMQIPKETALAITEEVNEKIFRVIRNTLRDIQTAVTPEETKKNDEIVIPQKPKTTDPYREPI